MNSQNHNTEHHDIDHDDPLIDSLLAEHLGEQSPPDLSRRILAQWRQRSGADTAAPAAEPAAPPVQVATTEPPVQATRVAAAAATTALPAASIERSRRVASVARGRARRQAAGTRRAWLSGMAVGLLVALGFWGLYAASNRPTTAGRGDLARRAASPGPNRSAPTPRASAANKGAATASTVASRPSRASDLTGQLHYRPAQYAGTRYSGAEHAVSVPVDSPLPAAQLTAARESQTLADVAVGQIRVARGRQPRRYDTEQLPKIYRQDSEVVAMINERILEAWQAHGVKPAPAAAKNKWMRRVYLGLLGRVPTVEELKRHADLSDPSRRAELVRDLLSRREFAQHWSGVLTNAMLGHSAGLRPGDAVNRTEFRQYLAEALHDNAPYDELAFELVTAVGSNHPGSPDHNPATNFLIGDMDDKAVRATSRIGRIFLGRRLDCAQCHNGKLHEQPQKAFWQLNSFLRQAVVEHRDTRRVLLDRTFTGEGGEPASQEVAPHEAEVYFELPDGRLEVAYPVFPNGEPLFTRSGSVGHVNRRVELANFIARSPELSHALVNRVWAQLLGHGFTDPVDDMGPHNPASHPILLDRLASAFRASGYDLKRLVTWIVLSEPYQRSSRHTATNQTDDPQAGSPPLFSRYYARQMQPEQLYNSVLAATGRADSISRSRETLTARQRWLRQFFTPRDTDDGGEESLYDGSITQAFSVMTGRLTSEAISLARGSFLSRLAEKPGPPQEKVALLYQATLSRPPQAAELEMAGKLYLAHNRDVGAMLQDVLWALLNSNEFILDH